jgi:ketosteroid isomerase-like protein
MSQDSVELLLKGYRAFVDGDLETIGEMLDPDVEWRGIGQDAGGADRASVLDVLAERLQEGYRVTLERCIGSGDRIVVSARFSGVEADPTDDRPLQSRRYYTIGRYAAIVTMRNERVVRVEEFPHLAAALEAAGFDDELT